MEKNKGITLVALVITIIVLIILAGVTINIIFDNNGIISKAKEAGETTKKASAREKMKLLLAEYEIEASTRGINISEFFAEKKDAGEIDTIVEDIEEHIIIELDGYEFTIDKTTREIINVADTNIRINISYPEGTVGETAKAVITVTNNKKTVDSSSLIYGWSNMKITEPTTWTSFVSGDTLTHAIVGQEIWFLWIKANYEGGTPEEETIRVSNQFNNIDNTEPTISLNKEGDIEGTNIVKITATISYGFSGVKAVKWQSGEKTETDFEEGRGNLLAEPYQFNVSKNGLYTVYIEGNNGKKAISTTQVINIIEQGWQAGSPNAPEIVEGMMPIKYNGTNWVVTTTSDTDWYNYIDNTTENATISTTIEGQACRKWANVMLSDGTYKAQTVSIGQEVIDSELGSMLVWIPRYSYKITSKEHEKTSVDTAGTIAIKFSNGTTDNISENYIQHPSFTNIGNNGLGELKGIWVGKFETSNSNGNIKIVPDASSWIGLNVSSMFTKTRNMEKTNIYGWTAQAGTLQTTGHIAGDTNTFDTHMMKNIEWGAVAYLTHAIGKTGKVIAKIGGYKTYTEKSTTDNIYGIYDMSGGKREYVMAVYNNTRSDSGFTTLPLAKYYDNYTAYSSQYKGDAVYETSPGNTGSLDSWYGGEAFFIHSTGPWLYRNGMFGFGGGYDGDSNGSFAFRVVCVL